ncbi:sensor histidine kinase [Phytohabitans suffuscus]|uniref:Histidine kinase/HSP90-like ATPase domain-containing protein n=1 Tax=Phytohabitans suffuscus TaxID=624315 RepID=A0A6F8YK75_9ACTN|nr:sensor histidine kinase [Phytohabitans suffuscus]BCB86525.1 hypothetical protein Psuf_038380 [Phytohabitans suffuscus]
MSRFAAYFAICRALLLGRFVVTLAAAGVGVRVVDDTWRLVGVLALIMVATAVEVGIQSRWPSVLRWRLAFLTADAALMIGVLVLSEGGVAYFCFGAGWAALSGALLGLRAFPLWIANAGLGLTVASQLLRMESATTGMSITAPFVLAFPMIYIVCGFAGAGMVAALARYIEMSVAAVAATQRSAAASERARLARELHDSVAKTLRGVSFAAVALPSLLRNQPDVAEQLATTVSEGTDAAVREARELLTGLRLDVPDRPFAQNVERICRAWAEATGIPVQVSTSAVDLPLTARYELARILDEALHNVARHADAAVVQVSLHRSEGNVELTVQDDGTGFRMPGELADLPARGHFGIVGMFERAQAAGGALQVRSAPGAGTTLVIRVPLAATGIAAAPPTQRASR